MNDLQEAALDSLEETQDKLAKASAEAIKRLETIEEIDGGNFEKIQKMGGMILHQV